MRIRCPNPVCREIFQVPADETEPKRDLSSAAPEDSPAIPAAVEEMQPPIRRSSSGSVGDVVPILDAEVLSESAAETMPAEGPADTPRAQEAVPILPAEIIGEEPPAPAEESVTWKLPPPVRKRKSSRGRSIPGDESPLADEMDAPTRGMSSDLVPVDDGDPLAEAPASWTLPPPIRRPTGDGLMEAVQPDMGGAVDVFEQEEDHAPQEMLDRELGVPPTRVKRALWLVTVMILGALVLIAVGTIYTLNAILNREQNAFVKAQNNYVNAKYATAAEELKQLIEKFPRSTQVPFYQFLQDLCEVRDQVHGGDTDSRQAWVNMRRFLDKHKDSRDLKEGHAGDVRETLLKLTEVLAMQAEQEHDRPLLAEARTTLTEAIKFRTASFSLDDEQARRQQIATVEAKIASYEHRQQILNDLRRMLASTPTADAVREKLEQLQREGLANDPEILDLLRQLEDKVRALVRYVVQEKPLPRPAPESIEPSFLPVAKLIGAATPAALENRKVIMALVRGLLFALDRDNGTVLWATRVGVDSTNLPVRLPATLTSPELFLVLSADSKTLMALEAQTGNQYWQHQLSAECLGRPVIVGKRAYVPTYDGKVHEIEIISGTLLGYFDLGQPLTGGGVWQQGTDLIYMPGDNDNLYVLDTALTTGPNQPPRPKQCLAILHTGHPSGSLRSEPIIINRPDPYARDLTNQAASPSYLILSQSDGLNHMKLRVYSLPIQNSDALPILQTEPPIRGWSWFQPYHDGEKLAFVTDVGTLGLFGINQVRNVDPPLFREITDKAKLLPEATLRLGRAQVVHAVENNFWVLSNGDLQSLHFDRYTQQVVPLWAPPSLHLGSPVHASQIDESGKRLFIVTHDPNRQGYLATAVEAETSKILWQRQLGLDSFGDPLVLGQNVLLVDRGGGLWRFEGGKSPRLQEREWRLTDALVDKPLEMGAIQHYWLSAEDGSTVYSVACAERGTQLVIRKYRPPQAGQPQVLEHRKVELPAPLAGPPSLGPRSLLLPLANNTIRQLALPLDGSAGSEGPNWRGVRADDDARGYVVHLGADDFLTTDGSNNVTHWTWPKDQVFTAIEMRDPTATLPARIVSPPVVLKKLMPNDELRVCVADVDENLTLLTGPQLRISRMWNVGGKITSGPFVRGQRIGCIVDRRRLVWIDPAQDKILWKYDMKGQGIIGQPEVVGDMVVVADESGKLVGLNPETGKPLGAGYTIKARAAPVATPVTFSAEEAFVPLTDGTVFLLALRDLRDGPASTP